MSEDKFEQEEPEEEDVEAHKKKHLNLEATELGSDESDDVEAHRKKHANEEPASDDESDDFEAHRRKN